ncbi:MAG: 4Fe-4S single cluster domain-containing protein [Nitrospirota bacterium]
MRKRRETLLIHSKLASSRANGPGERAVIWLQGCPFRCAGCFNPELRKPKAGKEIGVNELFEWLSNINGISGLTLSGGEPTEQIPALLPFLKRIREKTTLSVLLFSGRSIEQITSLSGGNKLLSLVDVLIDGRYDPDRANPPGILPSSSNQKIHFLTNRYSMADFSNLPFYEVFISEEGEVIETGYREGDTKNS